MGKFAAYLNAALAAAWLALFFTKRLGGPPCPTRADGVRIACDHVREAFLRAGHRPASLLPPNSKKRCVPMTGKQKCEMVPGGCTN